MADENRGVPPLAASGVITGASEEMVIVHFLGDTPKLSADGKLNQEYSIIATICLVPTAAKSLAEQITKLLGSAE